MSRRLTDKTAFIKEKTTLIGECGEQLISRLIGKIKVMRINSR